MMKKWISLMLAVVLLLALSACGGEATPPTESIEAGADVVVKVTADTFEEGTTVTAEAVTEGTVYERAKTAVKSVATQFTVFELNAVKDEAKVQPNGALAVDFPIPAAFSTNVAVYYVAEDGTSEKLVTTVNEETRTATAELTHFSTYVLADIGEESTTTTTSGSAEDTTTTATTTTTAKPTTTTTTTTAKPTTTTTTTKALSAFKNSNWEAYWLDEEEWLRTRTIKPSVGTWGESAGMELLKYFDNDEALMNAHRHEIEDCIKAYDGVEYFFGMGGGDPIAVTENGTAITLTDELGKKLVLTRVNETTVKVTSNQSEILDVKVGTIFTKL